MFNQYPYLNLNDLNLDYLLNEIKSMYNDVTNFVSINAIKYADPIQWNITSQYEKNTVVIDPLTGTAYISVTAVPSGVALTRTEYWTVVFDLRSFVARTAKNFTTRYEEDTTLTATFSTPAGEWLVWGDTLYRALVNIGVGDRYVVDSNIEHFTIEELKEEIIAAFRLADENVRGTIAYNDLTNDRASTNLPEGVLVYWHDNLYRTTTNIAQGDAYSTQTNLTPTKVDTFIRWITTNISNAYKLADEHLRGSIAYNELNSDTATANHSSGSLIWWHDNLYRTTTNISIGDSYVIGTNIATTTVEEFIKLCVDMITNAYLLADENVRGSIAHNELTSNIASRNINVGEIIWQNDNLYQAISNIPQGESFIVGTNIKAIKLTDLLNLTNIGERPSILTVAHRGANFTSINDAIDYAKTYCTKYYRVTIVVLGGGYNESIRLVDNPGIDLYGINHPTIRASVDYPEGAINFSGSMRIHGFQLLNTKADSNSYAIHYEAQQSPDIVSSNIHISDCDIASWGNAGIGAGLGSGDVFEVENCRIASFHSGSPAVLTHPYPLQTDTQASEYYRECTFKALGDYAIIVHNSRAMQGNSGTSNMLFRCIGCIADIGHNKIKYTYAANSDQAYIPRSGEIHLQEDSTGNNMIGVNYETAATVTHQYRLAMPYLYNWTDGTNYRRYSNGIEFKNRDLFTLEVQQCVTMDNTSMTARTNIDSALADNIGVNILDDLNDTYKNHIQTGIIIRINATPAL